jgi:hypothetical protein
MQLLSFTFGNNLDSRTVTVKGSTMRNAMHGAAMRLQVKEANLIFIGVAEAGKVAA